jgi:hypothetical protein
VLEEAFADGYMEAFPLRLAEPSTSGDASAGSGYTEEGEKEILERLEGLGYLG